MSGAAARPVVERLVDRLIGGEPRRFGALLSPAGVDLVEYRRERAGYRIARHVRGLVPLSGVDEAARRLAAMVEAEGGRGARVAVVLRGFGSTYRIVELPPAEPAVHAPIVAREIRRFDPSLEDPAVAFTALGRTRDAPPPKQELLVAAAPEAALRALAARLTERGAVLEHVTVLPAVLQRLQEGLLEGDAPVLLALLLGSGPVVGAFEGGWLRLVREPPPRAGALAGTDPQVAGELVKRASLYLRQRFHGRPAERLLLAAEAEDRGLVDEPLQAAFDGAIEPLGPADGSPAALAALGAGLDAATAAGLNLLPPALRPPALPSRGARAGALAAAALLCALALGAAFAGLRAEARAHARLAPVAAQAAERSGRVDAMVDVASARARHGERLALLERLAAQRQAPAEVLALVAGATPRQVRLDRLRVTMGAAGWGVELGGAALAPGGAAAIRALDTLYRELSLSPSVSALNLDRMDEARLTDAESGVIAIDFTLSFVVQCP